MKLTFEVGNAEKHRIDFFWSQFWGRSFLAVDGTRILTSGVRLSSPLKIIGKNDVASGWKARLPYALTRDDWRRFLPYPFWYDYADIELVHRWTVVVGTAEQHRVTIEKERARWVAGLRPSKYRVLIDDALVREYRGY